MEVKKGWQGLPGRRGSGGHLLYHLVLVDVLHFPGGVDLGEQAAEVAQPALDVVIEIPLAAGNVLGGQCLRKRLGGSRRIVHDVAQIRDDRHAGVTPIASSLPAPPANVAPEEVENRVLRVVLKKFRIGGCLPLLSSKH